MLNCAACDGPSLIYAELEKVQSNLFPSFFHLWPKMESSWIFESIFFTPKTIKAKLNLPKEIKNSILRNFGQSWVGLTFSRRRKKWSIKLLDSMSIRPKSALSGLSQMFQWLVKDPYHWKYGTSNLYLMLGFWHECTDWSKRNIKVKMWRPYHGVQMSTQHWIQLQCFCSALSADNRNIEVEFNVRYFQWEVFRTQL